MGLGLLLETVFENYYMIAKERMVKETEYVAVLAEEQGFDDVLKIHIYLKARRKIQASIAFVDEKKFNIAGRTVCV